MTSVQNISSQLTTTKNSILAKSLQIDTIFSDHLSNQKLIHFLKKNGGKSVDYAFYPLSGNNKKNVIWVLDRDTLDPVGIIDVDPWQVNKKIAKNTH